MTASRTRGVAAVLPLGAVLTVLAVLVSGCGLFGAGGSSPAGQGSTRSPTPSSRPAPAPVPGGPVPAGLASYYAQRLHWTSCRDTFECARLRVPLDYARPGGRSIRLALLKAPALDPARRLGSMVVDPGGPGASGVDYAAGATTSFGRPLREVYDVVGLDPRGVGASSPIDCVSDARLSRMFAYDPDPDTAAERRTLDGMYRALGRGCLRHDPALTRHMSTAEVARDLDILRSALGDRRLTYFGASYGTEIGAAYAARFPRRVGRMVLDGAVDPSASSLEFDLVQARGFERALRSYVGACVAAGSCFLGGSVDAGVRRVQGLLAATEDRPLPSRYGPVTKGMVDLGVTGALYSTAYWPVLDRAIQQGLAGDGTLLQLLADGYLRRDPDGRFQSNLFEAYFAVTCLDEDDGVSMAEVHRYVPRFERASPTFGRMSAYALPMCHDWPVRSGQTAHRLDVTKAPPILVVGTTRDPATPLVWAQSLSRQLHGSVLVTRDGDGHTGYHQGSPCVDNAVEDYLVKGTVPSKDVSC
ncbi:MAG TPA: alpha/beta hydrolase [Nocardioidaceae bacterium]|nr:alpha/beta hydrolase [Nocardioidaceae bacterium]